MNLANLCTNIIKSTEELAKKEIMGLPIESADPKLLDITESNLNEHVSMQPIAMAFWGAMYKQALRNYERTKRDYDMWRRSKYSAAKDQIQGKCTIADIEAKLEEQNEAEIKIWIDKLDKSEDQSDTLESYYKAWSQKAFSLKEHAAIHMDDYYQKDSLANPHAQQENKTLESESFDVRKQRIREMMNKSRNQA